MANQGFRRSFRTPPGYSHTPSGRVGSFNQVYQAYVKNNDDAFMMGRLLVWIPEFSDDPTDESHWLSVRYCSPFAGATPVKDNVKEGRGLSDTQQSYGWWSVPPDLDNEVVVMFINGDPNRGIWIGGMYQQFMNHMVPGIPTDSSYTPGPDGQDPPVAEYNRWDPGVTNSDNHTRARFEPLHQGLLNQGLYTDPQRGPSDSGARRAGVSKVYGFKSPGGSHLVFDDQEDNQHIRIRTAGGAQVLINDTTGYVYVNSGNGNSWLEVSDEGVDVYSAKSVSLRSQGDMNFHADGSMNFYAKRSWNVYGGGGGSLQFKSLDVLSASTTNISSGGSLSLLSKGDVLTSSSGNMSIKAGGTSAIQSGGALGVSAGGDLFLKGSQIRENAGKGPTATAATEARGAAPSDLDDRDLNVKNGYEEITTKSIVSRMPTHEPWSGHPVARSSPASKPMDTSVSSRTDFDGNNPDTSNNQDVSDADQAPVPTDNTQFVAPCSGPITSLFGPRHVKGGSRDHKGIDIGVPIGTPVVAARAGVVIKAGASSGYGMAVFIQHDDGYTTEYGHISAATVSVHQRVVAGQQIARSGNLGHSTGPHLHFTIRKGGAAINPASKLKNVRIGGRLTAGRN